MEGTITRKDIIEDQALNWGGEYAKIMEAAIGKNKEFLNGLLAMNDANNLLRNSANQKEYVENQKKVNEQASNTIVAWKEQIQLENALISAKRKNELATESTNRKLTEERLLLAQTNKLVKQEVLDRLGLTGAYEKLSKARDESKKKLRDLIIEEGKGSIAVKAATKEYEQLDKKVRLADKAVGDFTKNVGNYPQLTGLKNTLKDLVGAFGIATGVAAFTAVLSDAYKTLKTFEQGVADLSAITGASGKDLNFLKSSAVDLGKTVAGGAIAVVEAYKLIASAKPELLENVKALNSVTESAILLSQAAGMELPEAATALTDALNQFNAPAEKAGEFVDALANGAKFGAAEIPQTTEALLKFGAVARTSNISIQESVALIELLAENGIKGAEAGTKLRNVLLKISAPDALPKEARKEFERLGISLDFLKDNTIPIQEKLEKLKPLLKDNASIVKIFGDENATAAINILSHTDRLQALIPKMGEFGTAGDQAAIRMNTVNGKTEQLKSTYDSLILSIGEGSGVVSGFFGFFIDGAKNALNELIRLNTSWDELYEKSKNEGAANGVALFNQRLTQLKNTGTELEVSLSIAKTAFKDAKIIEAELAKANKEIREREGDSAYLGLGESRFLKLAKERKEQLTRALAEQNAIIEESNKRREKARTGTKVNGVVTETTTDVNGLSEKEQKEALRRAKKLSDDLFNLEKQRLERIIKINEEIAKDEEQSDSVRIAAVEQAQKKEIQLVNLTKQNALNADKFLLDGEKLSSNEKVRIKEDASNKIVDINKKASEQINKINEFDLASYQANLDEGVKKIEIAMNSELAAENEKFADLGDLEALSQAEREKAIEDHERRIFEIKKEFALATAKLQADNLEAELNAFKAQSDGSEKSNKTILDLEKRLSEARLKLTQLGLDNFKEAEEKKTLTVIEQTEQILEVSSDMTNALADLAFAFSDAKIQRIDDEINKNNEYYDNQIELAGNDERQKDLLQKERDKKNDDLEKKKRKEQQKQAIFEKSITVAQIGLKTALAIISAAAATAPTFWGVAIASAIGALQLGAALATPIPKYKDGRKGGPAQFAYVGDGGVPEVVTDDDGSNPRLTPSVPTLTYLKKDDKVFSSMAEYQKYLSNSVLYGIASDNYKMIDFQNRMNSDTYGKESFEELKKITQAIKSQKFPTMTNKSIDINHHLWKKGNTNWS